MPWHAPYVEPRWPETIVLHCHLRTQECACASHGCVPLCFSGSGGGGAQEIEYCLQVPFAAAGYCSLAACVTDTLLHACTTIPVNLQGINKAVILGMVDSMLANKEVNIWWLPDAFERIIYRARIVPAVCAMLNVHTRLCGVCMHVNGHLIGDVCTPTCMHMHMPTVNVITLMLSVLDEVVDGMSISFAGVRPALVHRCLSATAATQCACVECS